MIEKRPTVYLIDGSNYVFRAYYAVKPLSNSKGLPTNAIYGFTQMLLKLLKEEVPDYIAVAFDSVEKTFRDELFPDYKATRKEPPNDLIPQFPYFPKVVDALNIPMLIKPGFEADDIIATIAEELGSKGYNIVIVTGDKDFMQLVSDRVTLLDTMKGRRIGVNEVKEKFGVSPERVVDVLSLAGDSTDNVPGVKGIGPKLARSLIAKYGSVENLLNSLERVSAASVKEKLREHAKDALLSKALVTIRKDVPLEYKVEDFKVSGPNDEKLRALFEELEFSRLLEGLSLQPKVKGKMYTVVSDSTGVAEIVKTVKKTGRFAIEVVSFPGDQRVEGLAISPKEGEAFYVPLNFYEDGLFAGVGEKDVFKSLKPLFEDKDVIKAFHGFKACLNRLLGYGIDTRGMVIDTELISYLLNPSLNHDLKEVARRELKLEVAEIKNAKAFRGMDLDARKDLLCGRADVVMRLSERLMKRLKDEGLFGVYSEIEFPLTYVLSSMERRGVKVDTKILEGLSEEYGRKLDELAGEIYSEAGEEFSIRSPKQLSWILFEKLGLPAVRRTKTGYSTDNDVLTELAKSHRLPELILDYRSLSKLKSAYIDALPLLVSNKSGRIHTTFNQTIAATGRLSSSNPNLQNIPARTEEGRRIREAFIADEGFLLVSADYSQIELRVLAHMTGEDALVEAFKNDLDIHAMTAARIFGKDPEGISDAQRMVGKTVNFSVLYGQTPFGLSRQLMIEVEAAKKYIDEYFTRYGKVSKFRESVLESAREKGYVETLFGRRRYFPDMRSANESVRALNERMAFNTVFQGTAADIIKKAMIEIFKGLPDISKASAMILQVHDELVFEVPEEDIDAVRDYVVKAMTEVVKLNVPLKVDTKVGRNWAEC